MDRIAIGRDRCQITSGSPKISGEIEFHKNPLYPSIYLHPSSLQARNIVPANCRSSSIHERINSINKLLLTDRKSMMKRDEKRRVLTRRLPIDVCLARSVPPTTRNESVAKQSGGRRRGLGRGVELDSGVVIANATTPSIRQWFLSCTCPRSQGASVFNLSIRTRWRV